MKVGIAINTSWNIYNFRIDLVKRLLELGHEVLTIAPNDEYASRLIEMGCCHRSIQLENSGLNPIKDLQYMKDFRSILSEEKPDIVLSYTIKPNIYGTLACKKENIPIINNVSGLGTTFLWNKLMKAFIVGLYKYAFRKSNFIFFQNQDDKDLFLDEVKIDANKTGLLPGSGINIDFFNSYRAQSSKGPFTFLMISRLLIDKGVMEYCEAAKILKRGDKDVKFLLLGKQDPEHKRSVDLDRFDQYVKDGVVEFLGTSDDVREFIAKSDCVVLPSYREGTPRTLLEAACMSKPLVATNVPGCKNVVIDNYNGFLCNPRDSKDLADAMSKMLLSADSQLKQFGENSNLLVTEKFDVEIVIEKYFDEINRIIPGTSPISKKSLVSN